MKSDAVPNAETGIHELPTCAYTVFLALAAGIMATVSVLQRSSLWMAIGGFLFLVSDAFLAAGLFQDKLEEHW